MKLYVVDKHNCDNLPPDYTISRWNTGKWMMEKEGGINFYGITQCIFCGEDLK